MAMIYRQGIAPIVTVCGPGNLHHLTYMPASNGGSAVGMLPTANEGTTNFLLGFSFNYAGYAFYWDGNSTVKEPVGTSWANATSIPFNKLFVQGVNVQANVAAAGNVGETVTIFFIPDDLD
ncbi:hypothetical protein C8J57DRAFT_1240156 [Mycena rebaudengoi]|nr:hypothetical protein C8J57DRAFT_1240156 [Mycena rebaudengoi]